jgi:hypothetical protein
VKILFVALSGSIHTSRWISQVEDQGWNLYLFPSYDNLWINKDLQSVKYLIPLWPLFKLMDKLGLGEVYRLFYRVFVKLNYKLNNNYYEKRLHKFIRKINPDIIHSMETQGGGYLVNSVKIKYFKDTSNFPMWWHVNWGSDFFIFGRIPHHKNQIQQLLANCDYYSCECKRDVFLAQNLGYKNHILPVYPNSGGLRFEQIDLITSNSTPPSKRRIIMLKGYQGWAGRALVGIRALSRCKDILSGYKIVIYTNTQAEDIKIASSLFFDETGIPIELLKEHSDHATILQYHSIARISIGLSIGDAISTSLIEAMSVGSFPIQSNTSCADEWIIDGETGIIVPPEDPEIIEMAIRKAISDDNLVDKAAEINCQKVREDIDYEKLKSITIQTYLKLFNAKKDE